MKKKLLLVAVIVVFILAGCTGMKFTNAVSKGETETVKAMLNSGDADVNKVIGFGKTPIFYAVENGHIDMVKLLMEKGAKINVRDDEGRGPLTMAAIKGNDAMVKAMVEAGGEIDSKGKEGMTALMIYADKKDGLPMVKYLVQKGADVNAKNERMWGKYAINIAAINSMEIAEYLMDNGAEVTEGALYSVLKKDKKLAMKMLNTFERVPSSTLTAVIDDDEMFNYLLQSGANASAVVEACARTGNVKALRKLAEAGADPNQIGNPLEVAKNAQTASVLVEMGADVNKGFPVHEAVMDEDIERVKFLVNEAGADMNKQNKQGTAMHLAAMHQKFNMLKVLLECKGPHKFNLQDEDKKTVLDYIGTKITHGATPRHYKNEYKGVSRDEIRSMLIAKGAKYSREL